MFCVHLVCACVHTCLINQSAIWHVGMKQAIML